MAAELSDALSHFRRYGAWKDMERLMLLLRMSIDRNVFLFPMLTEHLLIQRRQITQSNAGYVDVAISSLNDILKAPEDQISFSRKLEFFEDIQRKLGRTALCLSGGGNLSKNWRSCVFAIFLGPTHI